MREVAHQGFHCTKTTPVNPNRSVISKAYIYLVTLQAMMVYCKSTATVAQLDGNWEGMKRKLINFFG